MSGRKLCVDCAHFQPRSYIDAFIVVAPIPAKCGRTDLVTGDGTHARHAKDERADSHPTACGTSGIHWTAKP